MTEDEGGGMVTRPCLQPLKPPHTPCAFINHLPDSFSAFLGASGVDTMCWYFSKNVPRTLYERMNRGHCTNPCTPNFEFLAALWLKIPFFYGTTLRQGLIASRLSSTAYVV